MKLPRMKRAKGCDSLAKRAHAEKTEHRAIVAACAKGMNERFSARSDSDQLS